MTVTAAQRTRAYEVLRVGGLSPDECRELLAGPKGLRDEFAAAALSAVWGEALSTTGAAKNAYQVADAMLLERAKGIGS